MRVHLDKRRTVRSWIRRKIARSDSEAPSVPVGPEGAGEEQDPQERFPFHRDDLTYKRVIQEEVAHSNAVVICIMDTSGFMDTVKKYLARSFFFLLHRFVFTRYWNVEVVFVPHHTESREVTEEEFFHNAESGGHTDLP